MGYDNERRRSDGTGTVQRGGGCRIQLVHTLLAAGEEILFGSKLACLVRLMHFYGFCGILNAFLCP